MSVCAGPQKHFYDPNGKAIRAGYFVSAPDGLPNPFVLLVAAKF